MLVAQYIKNNTYKIIAVLFGCILLFSPFFLVDDKSIRIHDDQVEVQKLANAVVRIIIEEGYGYRVEFVESTIKEVRQALASGSVDLTLELWKENHLPWFQKHLASDDLIDLGQLYDGGKQYWIVSRWYAEENDIATVFDMSQHWGDFLDPGDSSKGLFLNCIVGWACRDINRVKLQAYGLDKYYNPISPISPEALREMYARAHQKKLPIFGYYWEPNSLMLSEDWHILEEPDFDQQTWLQILEASRTPNQSAIDEGCAYSESGASKVAHSSLKKKAPDVVMMLSKMKLELQMLAELIFFAEVDATGQKDYDSLGRLFLTNHPEIWSQWVPVNVQQKVADALSE